MHPTPWQDVHPERGGRQRPPLRFDWQRIAAPPNMTTTWVYLARPPGDSPVLLYAYRQGRTMWRWAIVARDVPEWPPIRTGITDTKGRAQLAAENWHAEHVRPQPTFKFIEESDNERRQGAGTGSQSTGTGRDGGDDLPF